MVSRAEVTSFPVSTPAAEILAGVLEERFTRVPVYEDSIDQVVGVLHLKDLVQLVQTGGSDVRGILRNVLRVPEASVEPPPVPVHLVYPAANARTAKVRAFVELAAPRLRALLAAATGRTT